MPFAGAIRTLEVFSGVPTEGVIVADLSPRLPAGFDAVAQFSRDLLQASLVQNLTALGLVSVEVRRPWGAEVLPEGVAAAFAAEVRPQDSVTANLELAVEFRLTNPRLRTLGERWVPPVLEKDARTAPAFPTGKPGEIAWVVELNLLRIRREPELEQAPVLSRRSGFGATRNDENLGTIGPVFEGGGPVFEPAPPVTITRTAIARGSAVTRAPLLLTARLDLLQTWVEFDLAAGATAAEPADDVMGELLDADLGEAWLEEASARLTAASRLRGCPRTAFGGALTSTQTAALGLTHARPDFQVHVTPDGAEVLSLSATFGADAHGLIEDLHPFLGNHDFALFVSRQVIDRVVRVRWRTNPRARMFINNVTVGMPFSEGSEVMGDGTARVHVRVGDISDVGLMAAPAPGGDVLRLTCEQTVQVLALWWPNGQPVRDLGELGEPADLPVTLNIAPYGRPEPGTDTQAPFRLYMLKVLEPLAVPLLDRFGLWRMQGFVSEALDACVCRWSLPDWHIQPTSLPGLVLQT